METRSKATRDLALSEDVVIPSAEFPTRMGESTPESGDLGDIGAAGIVGDSRPSSTRPPTEVVSPHMSIHEADTDVPPLLQRADLAQIGTPINPCPLHINVYYQNIVNALLFAEQQTVPRIPHSALKAYWSVELYNLKEKFVFWQKIRESAGCPKGLLLHIKTKTILNFKLAVKHAAVNFENIHCDDNTSTFSIRTAPHTWNSLPSDIRSCHTLHTSKNTSKHTCSDSLNLKPPVPLYPSQDFKALYKYCIIIINMHDFRKWWNSKFRRKVMVQP